MEKSLSIKISDGYLAREKGRIHKNRIQNNPTFQSTYENDSEFEAAAKYCKVLRNAIRLLWQNIEDKRAVNRVTED